MGFIDTASPFGGDGRRRAQERSGARSDNDEVRKRRPAVPGDASPPRLGSRSPPLTLLGFGLVAACVDGASAGPAEPSAPGSDPTPPPRGGPPADAQR